MLVVMGRYVPSSFLASSLPVLIIVQVDVLQWWLSSGLQLIFDPDCLTGATRHNRPEVLEWWDKSALPIQYRMCDIEEALEDAIGGGEAAREWWRKKGVDFNANDTEWMKLQNLN